MFYPYKVSFHPKNHNVICVVGSGFFRMCKLTEGILKPFGFQKVWRTSYIFL